MKKDEKAGLRKIYRKSWPYDNLYGSSRFELSAADRGIWNDLIDLAKLSRVKPGIIAPGEKQAYPHQWLAGLLNVTLEEFEHAIKVLIKTNRVEENHTGITIVNWTRYQTDYDRQRPYRERGKGETQEYTKEEMAEIDKKNKARLEKREEAKKAGL